MSSIRESLNPAASPVVHIYTDGGCSPNPGLGGYAAILTIPGKDTEKVVKGAVPDTTNYRMEILAVVMGLRALKRPSEVIVHCDNNNVVKGYNDWMAGWIANDWLTAKKTPVEHRDLWEELNELRKVHQLKIVKVKAHSSENLHEKMNKRADALVAQSRQEYTQQSQCDKQPSKDDRLLISGSRRATDNMLEYGRQVIARAIENGWTIVVGDNPHGVDKAVVDELNRLGHKDAIVVGIRATPRNGGVNGATYIKHGKTYAERDQAMARASKRGMFIWNGKSSGTKAAYLYMKKLEDREVYMVKF